MIPTKDYAEMGGTRCPACNSDKIRPGAIDTDVGVARQDCTCRSCGASWRDVYALIGFDQLEVPVNEADQALVEQLAVVGVRLNIAIEIMQRTAPLALARYLAEVGGRRGPRRVT